MKKVALITGASSGIGKEFARIHAKNGGDLVLVARRKDLLENLRKELLTDYSIDIELFAIDLTTSDAAQQVYDFVQAKRIQVEYLFNNAGVGGYGYFSERNLIDEQRMIQLNILALTSLTHLFLQDMKSNRKGYILSTASSAGFLPGPMQAVYFSTKAYVVSLTKALSHELKGSGVTISALCPGPVATEFEATAGMKGSFLFKYAQHPADTAKKGYRGLLKGKRIIFSDFYMGFALRCLLPSFQIASFCQ